ncbi:MAG: MFS transporter [Anaerolineales bacterium]
MSTSVFSTIPEDLPAQEYARRIRAWTLYDWANSAFATTILAAVLPIYFSQVAGATLPSEAVATAYWSLGLSVSLFIVAIFSPILGTISDISRSKKRFLAGFASLGVIATALLVLVTTGDWVLASILAILGRIGFNGSIVFYDSLLPHVARPADQDRVSARGFAIGYLGGGLLLAINVVMIFVLPGTWGPRLSFLSVAIWWAVFSIPLLRRVPEPPTATEKLAPEENVFSASLQRLRETFTDMRKYRQLFRFLIAFLIYNDGIGTIIGVAAIYGAELGFGSVELILALLLVQFVGIPFSLIFGSLPSKSGKRRPFYLAFVVFNAVALPIFGILLAATIPAELSGRPLPPYQGSGVNVGQGVYLAGDPGWNPAGDWQIDTISGQDLHPKGLLGILTNPFAGEPADVNYLTTSTPGDQISFAYNGQTVAVLYKAGPEQGIWSALIDGVPVIDPDTGAPLQVDAYNSAGRYGLKQQISAPAAGDHVLVILNSGEKNPDSTGLRLSLSQIEVLPPARQSNLILILGLVLGVQIIGVLFAWLTGKRLFSKLADQLNTKRSVILALLIYAIIAVWGFFLNSTVEFWFLAWMVAIVQGGSQALSRSLYASMTPARKSGEFFGLFGVMEKFASLIGPLLFAMAAFFFGSSRPAILSLIALFVIGILILLKVNVEEGKAIAAAEDSSSFTS